MNIETLNIERFTKGIKRASAQRNQQQTKAVNIPIKQPTKQPVVAATVPSKPAFNLEAYRLDILTKAIAHIFNKQKGILTDDR